MSSGDGWTTCAAGHRHWGRYGAAGLLLVDDDHRVILQHRAPWTHEGDSWGVPGGARNSDESAIDAALREAGEEAALTAADADLIGSYVDDHVGWAYTTVVARATRTLRPAAANAESVSVEWHPMAQVDSLRLHRGFAAAWRYLRDVPRPLYLVLGAAAGPGAEHLPTSGIAAAKLPGLATGGLTNLYPRLVRATDAGHSAELAAEYAHVGQVLEIPDAGALRALL